MQKSVHSSPTFTDKPVSEDRPLPHDRPMRALVVDDDETALTILIWAIAELGGDVRGCLDPAEALRVAEEFQPDIILLDLTMPSMSGIELCRMLRDSLTDPNTKIIAQTGRDDRAARQATAAAGFDLHLVKPLRLNTLADIFSLLKNQRRHAAVPAETLTASASYSEL